MPRLSYGKRNAIRQALEMQRLCFTGAQLLDADLRSADDKEARARVATALGNLVRNWACLQESVRVLKGDPMPGSLRPANKRRRNASPPLPPESMPVSWSEVAVKNEAPAVEPVPCDHTQVRQPDPKYAAHREELQRIESQLLEINQRAVRKPDGTVVCSFRDLPAREHLLRTKARLLSLLGESEVG